MEPFEYGTETVSARHILFVEPDQIFRKQMVCTLVNQGLLVTEASDSRQATTSLEREDFDVVLLAKRLPDGDGTALLPRILAVRPAPPVVIVMTAYYSIEGAVEAIKCGAFDYLPKPFSPDHLTVAVHKALETRTLRLEMGRLTHENILKYGPDAILGDSPVIRDLRDQVRKIAHSEAATILIQGESGTGKDLVAKAIHYASLRAARPFVPITCSAIPDTLLESELFGHERGAFTDAKSTKHGLIELAEGGTAFFDEVAELSLPLQAKLLRFLEDRSFRRVGGTKDIAVNVRIVAATNVKLDEAVAAGRFRSDLYFRLRVVPLTLPPLRTRSEDIPLLAHHFVDLFNKRFRKQFEGLAPAASRRLTDYPWPGNVRELKNTIERVILLERGPLIEADLLLLTENKASLAPLPVPASSQPSLAPDQDLSLKQVELQMLVKALERTGGNQSRAAKLLGVSRDTVRCRIRQHGMQLKTSVVLSRAPAPVPRRLPTGVGASHG